MERASVPVDEIESILSTVDDTTFSGEDWNVVVVETESLSVDWGKLVVHLGLSCDLIDNTIKKADDSWSEALKQWIKQNYNTTKYGEPSWRTLLKAVAQVNKLQFKTLADKHKVAEPRVPATSEDSTTTASMHEMMDSKQSAPVAMKVETSSEEAVSSSSSVGVLSAKPKITFHRLNLEALSKQEKQRLNQELYAASEDISYKFQNLFSSTTDSLRTARVHVKELARHLECLGHLKPTFDDSGEPAFRNCFVDLKGKQSVVDAMSVISKYCSFFNYRLLEHIIDKLGAEEDKDNLARYKEDFARYGERHVFECPAVLGEVIEEGQANMFVALDASFDKCNVNHLHAFVGNLAQILNIPAMTLQLYHIGPGSLKLIFQLPLSVYPAIFPLSSDQEGALAGLGVTHISCGNYQFTRKDNKEVEDPSSKEYLAHTRSEESVGSVDTLTLKASVRATSEDTARKSLVESGLATEKKKEIEVPATDESSGHTNVHQHQQCGVPSSPHDENWSHLAAGSAVGKPLIDSALERSTATTTFTTAGVLHSCKNVFDKELDMGMGHGTLHKAPQTTGDELVEDTYSLTVLPEANEPLVLKEKARLLGAIDLKALVDDLGRLGNCVRIAYHGVAGFTELQIGIELIGYDVSKLCDKSAVTVGKFKNASTTVLSSLKATYEFLLDSFEDMALETLADVADTAKGMATAVEELQKDFDHQANEVIKCLTNYDHRVQMSIDALQNSIKALKSLSVVMRQAALFWHNLQEHCEFLAKDEMKKVIELAMTNYSEAKRKKFWNTSGFKDKAIQYYAGWVALDDVCAIYKKQIMLTQHELYTYLKEALRPDEAREKVKELAANFLSDLELQQKAIADRKEAQSKEDL